MGRLNEGPVWLAAVDGIEVGTFSALPDERGCYLRGMGVMPEARGSGAWTALLVAAIDYARAIDAATVWLLTTEFLHAALRLYERSGFVVEDPDGEPPHLHGTPLISMARTV